MATRSDEIVDVPGYGDKCATYREACNDAAQFAHDFSCDAWVVRYDPEYDNVWKVQAPAHAVALFVQRKREQRREDDLAYAEREYDKEQERESEAWRERYGTPWSAP